MNAIEGPPERKRLSATELSDLERERRRLHKETLAALSESQKEKIGEITGAVEEALVQYLRTPRADAELLDGVESVILNLGNALMYAGDASGTKVRNEDIKACLLGASFVLDVSRETRFDIDVSRLPLLRRFLELVDHRVTRWAELHAPRK